MFKKETIEKIADLARVEMDEKTKDKMKDDLSKVLNYVDKLKEVDVSGVDFKSISPIFNRVREDRVEDVDEVTKEKMRAMGKNKDSYFRVESI